MTEYPKQAKMLTNIRFLMVFFIALVLFVQSAKAQKDDYIIVYKNHLKKQKMLKRPAFAISRDFNIIPAIAAPLDANQVEQFLQDPNVEYIEPDYKIYALDGPSTTDEVTSAGIGALASSQTIPDGVAMVNAPVAWSKTKGAGTRVAVLDTGISMYHPDRGNVVGSVSFVPNEALEDFDGHGTHTSGTIAAAENGIGVVGVAPQTDLLIAKVLDNDGTGQTSWLISGIEWAISNNAKVINMSLGNSNYSAALDTACSNAFAAGALLVAAAGNDGTNAPYYPAALDSVIGVAAVDQYKNQASFSNYGSGIALAAPGVDVYSTVCPVDSTNSTGATADAVWSSTSHQANVVIGTAAGSVGGLICDCGLATGADSQNTCPPSTSGNIAYIQRGTNTFAEKVAHAKSKGAVGAIIANNQSGYFYSTLSEGSSLVVVSISQFDGTALHSLIPSGITGTVSVDTTLYAYDSGTSMACPHVAGVAALIFAAGGFNITPSEVQTILFNSAQNLGTPGRDDIFGYGLVDANAALSLIVSETHITFTISGNAGEDGVTMSGLPGNPVTSGGGLYIATVPYGWSGTVTPTKTGYRFTPPSRSYTNAIADHNSQNYTANAYVQGLPITITKFTVKAGKTRTASQDAFTINGTFDESPQDITGSTAVYIRLSSGGDMVFEGVIPYNSAKLKNGKYSYTRHTGDSGNIRAAGFDLNKKTFRIVAKGIDLTGMSSPVYVELEWGNYVGTGEAAEDVINGKKPIPMQLLSGYADALYIDKASVRVGKKANSDSLKVTGDIAFASGIEDLTQHPLTLRWGTQDFNVPSGGFKALANGRFIWTRPKGDTNPLKRASFDLQKCTFTISVGNTAIVSQSGTVACGVTYDAFDKTVAYFLWLN